jgi:RNA polymerase sigma-70 factor (ECF subfamily)
LRFELLYAKHGPAVKAYVLRRADVSLADDVVAEVFVVCWRRFEEVPPEPLPWLLGVARRVLGTQRRGQRRRIALRDRLAENTAGIALDTVADSLASATEIGDELADISDPALSGALARLSEADRELLLLIAWEGLTPAQAASVLAIKPTTARVRLLRARRRLTRALSQERTDPATCASLPMEASS